jgi:hypothetical protein
MLTGKPAFEGESLSDIVVAVLRGEPDWQALPAETPHRIRVLLQRCLRKDSRQRMNDAADMRIEIDDATEPPKAVLEPARSTRRHSAALILALLAGAAIAGVSVWILTRLSLETPPSMHLSFTLPLPTQSILNINANHRLTISPDGKKIVYAANRGDTRELYLRLLDEPEGRVIEGTTNASNPFFSTTANGLHSVRDRICRK